MQAKKRDLLTSWVGDDDNGAEPALLPVDNNLSGIEAEAAMKELEEEGCDEMVSNVWCVSVYFIPYHNTISYQP